MEISLKGINYHYLQDTPFSRQALIDVNIQIKTGDFVSIVGPSGSGKTTLIQLMSGYLLPTSGQMKIGPHQINSKTKSATCLHQKVGVVFQYPENQLFESTVEKDIAFGLKSLGYSRKEIEKRVDQALDWVGLDHTVKEASPFQLSGGMKRRVAIAGILALERNILILDEPTAGLDAIGKREILDCIDRLHHEKGITVILVTHQMNEVIRYTRHCFVMFQGTCVFEGPTMNLFSDKRLNGWNLEVPEIVKLTNLFQQKINIIPKDITELDDLESTLLQLKK